MTRQNGLCILSLVALVAMIASNALVVGAAEPAAGAAPSNGIFLDSGPAETCSAQVLPAGGQSWFQVAYHPGKDLEIYALGYSNVDVSVFDPQQISSYPAKSEPVGVLTPNKNEPMYLKSWLGHLWLANQADVYYVQASNSASSPASFSLCTLERPLFSPPAPATGAPVRIVDNCNVQPVSGPPIACINIGDH